MGRSKFVAKKEKGAEMKTRLFSSTAFERKRRQTKGWDLFVREK